MKSRRRGHALRRRYGHAARKIGMLSAAVTYDRGSDRYKAEISWPEIGSDGHISRSMKHHLRKSIPASSVLVRLTDVSKPASPRAIDEAWRLIAQEPDVQHIIGWVAKHEGRGR